MSAHGLADARGTMSGLQFAVGRLADKVGRLEEDERRVLWHDIAALWVRLAEIGLTCVPAIDESIEDGVITVESTVMTERGAAHIVYPASNAVEAVMAALTVEGLKTGDATQILIVLPEAS